MPWRLAAGGKQKIWNGGQRQNHAWWPLPRIAKLVQLSKCRDLTSLKERPTETINTLSGRLQAAQGRAASITLSAASMMANPQAACPGEGPWQKVTFMYTRTLPH